MAELVAQYPSSDLVEQTERQQLASVLERLEQLTPGSAEWGRLMTAATSLGAAIRAEQARRTEVVAADTSDLSLAELAIRARQTATRLEQLAAQLSPAVDPSAAPDHLGGAIAAQPEPTPAAGADAPLSASSPIVAQTARAADAVPESATCLFCRRSLSDCAALKLSDLSRWRTLHLNDPAERRRMDEEATAVMFHTMSHGSGITRW